MIFILFQIFQLDNDLLSKKMEMKLLQLMNIQDIFLSKILDIRFLFFHLLKQIFIQKLVYQIPVESCIMNI